MNNTVRGAVDMTEVNSKEPIIQVDEMVASILMIVSVVRKCLVTTGCVDVLYDCA